MINLLEGFLNLFQPKEIEVEEETFDDEELDEAKLEELVNYLDKVKGNKLVPALKLVINSLEKDIIKYDWSNHCMCNCGLVIQSILNTDKKTVEELFAYVEDNGNTWKDSVQVYCNASGLPTHVIFQLLYNKGFGPEDIVHLEYLSNPAILEIAKIDKTIKSYYAIKSNLILYLRAWLKILDGNNEITFSNDKMHLEAELLIAMHNEDYNSAAIIRDKIAIL